LPPGKEDVGKFLDYLKVQVAKSGVKVVLNKEATPEVVKKIAPDSVIVAVVPLPLFPIYRALAGKCCELAGKYFPERERWGGRW